MQAISAISFFQKKSVSEFQKSLDKISASGAHSLLILACTDDNWEPSEVDPILTSLKLPVIGGCFPNIIYQGQHHSQGTLIIGLHARLNTMTINNLSDNDKNFVGEIRKHHDLDLSQTNIITIVDGLASNIERFVEGLYSVAGSGNDTIGCGAGSLDFIQRPCLFTNQGLIQDAAVIASYPNTMHRGFTHGWEILDGPFLVTGSRANVLESLNYFPAYDIYRSHVEKASGRSFDNEEFFSIAKTYPLGIEKLGGEILVRDPIQVNGDSLVCVGEVPENAMVYLLQGHSDLLITSAGVAAQSARSSFSDACPDSIPSVLIFDCISRVLFLDNLFERELKSIESSLGEYHEAFGALTLGEITNSHKGPIDLLNKSTVIATL